MSSVTERLLAQQQRIADAARQAGRDPNEVRLIAVSKRHPASAIREAYEAGQRDFGENYVQELLQKAEELSDLSELRFHLIGHLQTKKSRQVAPLVDRVHTVDSVKLVNELSKRVSQKRETALPCLVEVNVSGEASKSGCRPEELEEILAALDAADGLAAVGLMTMPPASESPEDAAPYFGRLVQLRDDQGGKERLPELSMGMSHDAEVAVRAGATWVRIGTAIFGQRPPLTT